MLYVMPLLLRRMTHHRDVTSLLLLLRCSSCSNLPARFKLWRDVAVKGSVHTLDNISPGWLAAYKGYYADAGGLGQGSIHYSTFCLCQHLHDISDKKAVCRARLLGPAELKVPCWGRKGAMLACAQE
jgi:hypothetical protein